MAAKTTIGGWALPITFCCQNLRGSRKNSDPIKVNGQGLESVEQAMILGLQISSDLT